MRVDLLLFITLFGCTQNTSPSAAPSPTTDGWADVDPGLANTLQRELEEARVAQDLPGLAMAVLFHDDGTLWTSAVGTAAREPESSWTPQHRSRMGSVTKTFTAALVHQLVEEGVVGLDDPIEQWVMSPYTGVTVGELLSMSSGIVSYNYVGSFDSGRPWTPDELIQWAWDHEPELRFEPGTQWEYSNTNYVLLGLVIESATNQPYEVVLQERLLDPLELSSIAMSGSGDLPSDLVRSFGETGEDTAEQVDPSLAWSAGGLIGTPADIARWNDALLHGEVLTETSRARMATPLGLTLPDEAGYGMGLFHEGDSEYTTVGHTGGIGDYLTYAYTLEQERVTVVVMSNGFGVDLREASTYGWAAVLGVEYP